MVNVLVEARDGRVCRQVRKSGVRKGMQVGMAARAGKSGVRKGSQVWAHVQASARRQGGYPGFEVVQHAGF